MKQTKEVQELKLFAQENKLELPYSDQELQIFWNLNGIISDQFILAKRAERNLTYLGYISMISPIDMQSFHTKALTLVDPKQKHHVPPSQLEDWSSNVKADILVFSTIHEMFIKNAIAQI